MEDGGADLARRLDQLRVGGEVRAGPVLLRPVFRERRLGDDAPGEAERVDRHPPVLLGRKVVRRDERRGGGIGAPEMHAAAARRAQIRDACREGAEGVQALAPFVERQRLEVELEIGGRVVRARLGEDAHL